MSFKDIKAAIVNMDEAKITLEIISALIKYSPTKEEVRFNAQVLLI